MSEPTTLIFVRHGETAGNREGRYLTNDEPLADEGRRQATLVAQRLAADRPIHALYTSDLARAFETARIIGRELGLTPAPERDLRELDMGDWTGLLRSEVADCYPGGGEGWLAAGGIERLPGATGESCDDVVRRASACLARIVAHHPGERVVVVSHSLTLGLLLAEVHGWDRVEALTSGRVRQDNTAVSVVEVHPSGERHCLLLGCTAHLDRTASDGRT